MVLIYYQRLTITHQLPTVKDTLNFVLIGTAGRVTDSRPLSLWRLATSLVGGSDDDDNIPFNTQPHTPFHAFSPPLFNTPYYTPSQNNKISNKHTYYKTPSLNPAGGELAVEGVGVDIRYRPLEFDGWRERHWTLPFVGERSVGLQ